MTTICHLIQAYKSSRHWSKLAPNSKRQYEFLLKHMDLRGLDANALDASMADDLYDRLLRTYGQHRANHTIKVLRRIWSISQRRGEVVSNPFCRMDIKATDSRNQLWTEEQVESYHKESKQLGIPSMGLLAYLCYDLCQRPGDMRKLGWANYDGSNMSFTQEKTGNYVEIPVSSRLKDLLTECSPFVPIGYIVVSETTGRAYEERHMRKVHSRILESAGLPSCLQLRDLRRSGATALAEHGATEDEIKAITGHQSRQVLNVYVRSTKKLAGNGMEKRFG